MLLFAVVFAAGTTARYASAQTTIDYDSDDDGLIDVKTKVQLQAIHYDLNGDGTAESRGGWPSTPTAYATAYPNPMDGMGCPARDHDNDPDTDDEASCIGYELANDIDASGGWVSIGKHSQYSVGDHFSAKFVGNGFRVSGAPRQARGSGSRVGFIGVIAPNASVEGLGIYDANVHRDGGYSTGLAVELQGKLIGSYVENSYTDGVITGALATTVKTGSDYAGLIAHSYANGYRTGSLGTDVGGLVSNFENQTGDNRARCLNSYFSGDLNALGTWQNGNDKGLIADSVGTGTQLDNCYADNTTDSNTNWAWQGSNAAQNLLYTRSATQLKSPTGYTGPFANWDDYAADGTALDYDTPRTDFWHFGDSTTFPVLKGWGHDMTLAPVRSTTGTDTVNLCTRTLAVANAIIELLNDTRVLGGVSPMPTPTTLQPCTAATDTRSVTLTQLTNLAVTGPGTYLDLRPERTFPASERLRTLDISDFAYLPNVAHIDLSGNDLESLPPRLFHGVGLRYLDLSDNKLTSLPADLFAGIPTVNTTVGNSLLLNGNSLTDTGLPGRIFDPLTHINALDLSDNALTRINTRWFEKLVNLGAKGSSSPPYTHALGLHLGGNTITEHHYSHKIFSGVRESIVSYTGSTAGDTLRAAITTAITTAAGGTTPSTLILTGTDYYFNSGGGTTGYQASTVTSCLSAQTFGPGRGDYLGGTVPACQVQPHWTPADSSTDTAGTAPGLSTSGTRGSISAEFTHSSSSDLVAYQLRWRASPVDRWTGWQTAVITPAAGAKSFTMAAPDSGLGHLVQLRVLRTTGPPSAPIDGTATTTPADWVAGFDATTSTTTYGAIDLSWTAFDAAQLPANHSIIAFYYRLKLQSDPVYGAWRQVPDGSDTGTSLTDETGYTLTGLKRDGTYDIQLVGGIDGTDADSDLDYFTNRSTDTAAALEIPASLRAVPGTAPGTIAVTWNQQVVATTSQTRFRVRWKLKSTAAWTGVTWAAVADSDSDSQTHDETAYTITGLLGDGSAYDVEVGFFWNSTLGWQDAVATSSMAKSIPAPTGLTAGPSQNIRELDVSWDQQRFTTASNAKFQVTVRWSVGGAWIAWQDVADSPDPGSHAYDEISHTVTGLNENRPHDVKVRLVVGTVNGIEAQLDDVVPGYHPRNLTATAGDAPGTIDLAWDRQTVYSENWRRFNVQAKLSSDSNWPVPFFEPVDSRGANFRHAQTSYRFTGLTAGELYDVRAMFNRGNHDWPDFNYIPTIENVRAGVVQPPTNFRAVPSTTAVGALDLSWDRQTASTDSMSKFQYRTKLSSGAWTGVTWNDVNDGSDDLTHAYDETSVTVSGLQVGVSYDVQLRFHWNSTHGESGSESAMAVSASVPSPPNFRAEAGATTGAVVLSWDAMTGIDRFQYRYRTTGASSYGSWTDNTDSNSNSNLGDETAETLTTGLTAGTSYDFELRAVVGSTNSTAASDSTRAQRHSIPTSFAVAVGSNPGELDLSWGTPAAGTTVAGFQYRHKPTDQPDSAYTTWAAVPDSGSNGRADERAYTITSLWAGVSHDIQISTESGTTRSVPNSATTATATPTPVAAPTVLTGMTGSAPGAIALTWTAPASATLPTGDSIAHYQYRAKPASSATWGEWTDIPAANAASYTATVPNAYTLYDIDLRAAVADGTEGTATTAEYYSTAASATGIRSGIASPAGLTATAGTNPGDLNLTWTAQTTFGAAFTAAKYQVRHKLASASWPATTPFGWADITGSNRASASHTITGLATGMTYEVQLRFLPNSSLTSAAASRFGIPALPPTPTGLTATADINAVKLDWDQQSDETGTEAKYRLRYKKMGDSWPAASPFGWADIPSSTHATDTHTITGLEGGTAYNFELRFHWTNALGESASATVTATPTAVPTQSGLSATTSLVAREVDLTWDQQSAHQGSDVKFQVRAKPTDEAMWPTAWTDVPDSTGTGGDADTDTHNEDSYTVTGLDARRPYDFQLRLEIGDATGPAIEVTNIRAGYQPRGLQAATGTAAGAIDVSWTMQTANQGSGAFLTRAKPATGSWPSDPNTIFSATEPAGWRTVLDSDSDTFLHDEDEFQYTGLQGGVLYDIVVSFAPDAVNYTHRPSLEVVQARAGAVSAPTGFGASTSNDTAAAVDLSWDQQMASTLSDSKFQYRYKLAATAAWSTETWNDVDDGGTSVGDSDANHYNETSVTVTGLTAGASYDFQLRFLWSDAVGSSTAVSRSATASTIPMPPNFSATSGSVTDTVDLSWDTVSGITKFQYRRKLDTGDWPAAAPFGWADVPDSGTNGLADETSYTVTGLTGGMTYDFELRAHTAAATFGPVSTASATAQPQSPPTSYTASTGTNPGEIDLGWTAPAGSTHTGFQYRHKRTAQADSAYIDWADVPDSASDGRANETAYTITSLWAGVGYTVQIRAQSGSGASEPGASTTATATAKEVAAPTTLNATIGDGPGEIDITWTALATAGLPTGDAVVQYQYRTKLPSASWPTSAPLGWTNIPAANTTSYTITGLTAYTLYDIQLRAAIDDGTDTTGEPPKVANYHSEAVSATGARSGLARPANLRAAGGTNPGEIALTWDAQTAITTGFSAAKYQYRARLTTSSWPSGGGWTDIASSGLTTASHTLTDLMNGRQYDVEVRFVPSSSLMSAARSVRGTTTVVAVPAGFTASTAATTAGAIDLTWTAQSATSGNEAKYQYRRKAIADQWPTSGDMGWTDIADSGTDGAHNESSLTFTGLTAGVSYHVELRFHWSNAVGASAATATLTARASDVPIPGSFTASSGSDAGEIDLSWSAVTSATYEFRYKLASVSNYPTSGAGFWASAGSGTSYTITGLTARSSYNVQLRAVVSGSNSLPTPTATAQAQTTPGPATLTFSHGPNPGDIKIDWTRPTPPAPVEHYEYRYKLATAATYPSMGDGSWAEVADSGDTGTLQSDETTYTITGLQAGMSYHVQFRVYASSSIGYSLPQLGTQAARPVPPPTSFSASGGTNPGEVNLSWSAPTGVTILRYELRHRLGTTGAWSSWTSATASPYTYTGLLAGMSRTFQVRAVMQTVGASAPVSTTGTPTPVPTPASFSATTGVFPGEVDLSWMAVNGATSYEYRYTLSSNVTWPDDATWQSVAATVTSTTLTLLDEGAAYTIELRAAITNVGKSTMVARDTASARGADFTASDARPSPPAIPSQYALDAATIPGRIAIELPGGTDPFIYRYRTVNPGQWSRWFKVTPQAGATQYLIPDLIPGVEYEIQVRAYTGMTTGFTLPLTAEAQAAPLVAAEDFEASESSGVILLQWSSPALYTPDYYQYRTKPTGTQTWSEWIRVNHEGDRGSTQRKWVTGLESGISHDFELRMQTGAGPSPVASSAGSARLRIAEVHSIRPTVREVSVRVGDTIALTVDIYDGQKVLDNSIPDKPGSKLVFRWEDKLADGSAGSAGGTFATPNNERRVTYTAPSSPGRYIVTAEAQPDGVCTSHHEGAAEITDAERAQCTATFTIRVSGIPAVPAPRPDPVDPTGAIPTSMTDDKGGTYTVFTPTKGGTFTGTDITVTAPAGAIPDRTVVGIGATTSDIPTPAPIPGATMSLAGSYYDINAVADTGEPPIPSYTLNEPATACLPFPQEFRADLSNVVLVQRKSAGDLSILSTKIRSNAGDLTVCGTLTQLPATVAVARLGLVPAPTQTTPTTPADTPDTGATTPGYAVLLLTLLAGALLLTGMYRIRRIIL